MTDVAPAVRRGARDGSSAPDTRCRDVAIAHAERTADVYLHIVPAGGVVVSRAAARAARRQVLAGRAAAPRDGPLHPRGRLPARACTGATALRRAVDRALEGLDALLLPALADRRAAARRRVRRRSTARSEPVRAMMLRLTQLFNITGHPAIAIPCGTGADGLPRAIQLVGHRGGTERLLAVAAAVERQMTGGPDRSAAARDERPDWSRPAAFPAARDDSRRRRACARRRVPAACPVSAVVRS